MPSRRFLFTLFIIVLIMFLAKPSSTWQELKRMWEQRSWMLTVIVTIIGIYFFYGLYSWLLR